MWIFQVIQRCPFNNVLFLPTCILLCFLKWNRKVWSYIRQTRNLFIPQKFIGYLLFQVRGIQLDKADMFPALVNCYPTLFTQPLREQPLLITQFIYLFDKHLSIYYVSALKDAVVNKTGLALVCGASSPVMEIGSNLEHKLRWGTH